MTTFTTGADKRHDGVKHLSPRDQARAMARWGYLQATRNIGPDEVEKAARLYACWRGDDWDELTRAHRTAYCELIANAHAAIADIRTTSWN